MTTRPAVGPASGALARAWRPGRTRARPGVSRPKMLTRTLSLSWSSLISTISPEKSANGPSLTRTVSPMLVLEAGLAALGSGLLALVLDLQEVLDVPAGQRRGLGALADEAGDARRVADHVPGVVVEVAAHQQVAREDLLLDDDCFLPFLNSTTSSIGMTTSWMLLLHVHRGDAGLEVLLDLLLVARLRVDHEPPAGPVVGALRPGPGLLEQVVGVDDLDLGPPRRRRRPAWSRRGRPRRPRRPVGSAISSAGPVSPVGSSGVSLSLSLSKVMRR